MLTETSSLLTTTCNYSCSCTKLTSILFTSAPPMSLLKPRLLVAATPLVLAASFINIERVTCPKFPKLNTALPRVLSYKSAKSEVDQICGSQDMRTTNRQTKIPCFIVCLITFDYFKVRLKGFLCSQHVVIISKVL